MKNIAIVLIAGVLGAVIVIGYDTLQAKDEIGTALTITATTTTTTQPPTTQPDRTYEDARQSLWETMCRYWTTTDLPTYVEFGITNGFTEHEALVLVGQAVGYVCPEYAEQYANELYNTYPIDLADSVMSTIFAEDANITGATSA